MELYSTSSLEVKYDEGQGILFMACFRKAGTEEFIAGFLQALQYAEEHQVKRWLLDLRGIGSLNDQEESWLHTHLFPRIMMNLGTGNYVAMVLSEKCYQVLLKEAGKFGLQSYNSFIILNNFCEVGEALHWLQQTAVPRAS